MDGNNRWAKNKGLPSREGHKVGVKKARLAVEYALEKKIDYLTLSLIHISEPTRPY